MPSLPTHIAVQRLNNRAAFHMARDEYDYAIELLIDALKLWENVTDDHHQHDHEDEENDCSCSRFHSSSCPTSNFQLPASCFYFCSV